MEKLKEAMAANDNIILVSQGLDHIMRPLANYLGVERIISNRLDFRDGRATGRLLEPVIRPRGALAKITGREADGRIGRDLLMRNLGFVNDPEILNRAIQPARRPATKVDLPVVHFDSRMKEMQLSG